MHASSLNKLQQLWAPAFAGPLAFQPPNPWHVRGYPAASTKSPDTPFTSLKICRRPVCNLGLPGYPAPDILVVVTHVSALTSHKLWLGPMAMLMNDGHALTAPRCVRSDSPGPQPHLHCRARHATRSHIAANSRAAGHTVPSTDPSEPPKYQS